MLKKQRILVSGDSFAAEINDSASWVNLLKKYFDVTNIAQAGVSEYKILKQLQAINVKDFDLVVVVHTSPNRVFIKEHPLHRNSILHKNCDLIYNDILSSGSKDIVTTTAVNYFKYIFDESYYKDIHHLLVKEIIELTKNNKALHITFFKNLNSTVLDWSIVWETHQGNINHLNSVGNNLVLDKILLWTNQLF